MRFVSVGECMIEMAEVSAETYKLGWACDTLNTAWYVRALSNEGHSIDYVTALGVDTYSDRIVEFLEHHAIGITGVKRLRHRAPGLYLIHQADGDRHFTYWRGHSAAKNLANYLEFLLCVQRT